MGKKQKKITRVVLDTNVLISALLFEGDPSKIVKLWQEGRIVPVISKEIFSELRAVLDYPKFRLSGEEIKVIVEQEVLPYFEVVEINKHVTRICRDPDDEKFISCALGAGAEYLVSGDKDLIELKRVQSVRIIHVSEFLKLFASSILP